MSMEIYKVKHMQDAKIFQSGISPKVDKNLIVGLRRCCFAMIVSPTRFVFASPRHTVCKPLHVVFPVMREGLTGEGLEEEIDAFLEKLAIGVLV